MAISSRLPVLDEMDKTQFAPASQPGNKGKAAGKTPFCVSKVVAH